jgi:organic radical activating enzyme
MMNIQAAMPIEKKKPLDDKIVVKEMFYTIQGEGPYSGQPAFFLRLGGCNLQCGFCDTDYSDGTRTSIPQIKEAFKTMLEVMNVKFKPLVVITGGEPFRQYMLPTLCAALVADKYAVQIETNGTCYQEEFDNLRLFVSIVCSPKTNKLHKKLHNADVSIKLIIKDVDGKPVVCYHDSEEPLEESLHRWGHRPLFLQPLDDENREANVQATVAACLEHNLTISLQLHKILNLR